MTLVFAFALVVLAAAVVLLFAMLGELTSRLPYLSLGYRDPFVKPLEEALLGARPTEWPDRIAQTADDDGQMVIFALSTSCVSCDNVAIQLQQRVRSGSIPGRALVISCRDSRTGENFVRRHDLDRLPYYVDERGEWLESSFGVKTSPTALVVRDGVLQSALVFGDVETLDVEIQKSALAFPDDEPLDAAIHRSQLEVEA